MDFNLEYEFSVILEATKTLQFRTHYKESSVNIYLLFL